MPPVIVQVKMTTDTIANLSLLTEAAIQEAKALAIAEIRSLATKYTPVKTGRLLRSFDVGTTPQFIVMKWSATDPTSTDPSLDYAQIADTGRPGGAILQAQKGTHMRFEWPYGSGVMHFHPGPLQQGAMTGAHFSEKMRLEAPMILQREIANAIAAKLAASKGGGAQGVRSWRPPTGRQGF